MVGKTLRSYRIESKLGAGGMGVVYRAVDSRLERAAAIKVLAPARSSADRERRFAQEAKAASSLNHPNIITIYDISTEDLDGGAVQYIAMEFVAGETLDRLIRKGLRLREALKYAIQIADAMAAAHAAGIVHRDLKPSNVMVTPQGLVKVLDFGVAKLTDPEPDAYSETVHAEKAQLTEEGTVLGTVAYMSPEQAEGKKLDARSDIFSFGSLLYEMVSGRQAFTGGSKLSVLSAILNKDPQPAGETVADMPSELDRIIGRCLKKDPDRRWQSMADVKVALEELRDELDLTKSGAVKPAVKPAIRRPATARAALVAVAGLVLGLAPGVYLLQRDPRPEPPSFQRLTFRRGDVTSAKFAPGGAVVYSATWEGAPSTLYSAQPGNREARPLGLPTGKVLAISPTGDMAVLLGGGLMGTLARVPFGGGAAREILENVSGADWGPDGKSLAVIRTVAGQHRLEYPIGNVLYKTDARPPAYPRVSPDGRLVAFFDFDVEVGDYSLAVVGPDHPRQVLSRGWRGNGALNWSPRGDEVWFSAAHLGDDPALYGVDLSGKQRVVSQVAGWIVMQDVARDGRVLLSAVNSRLGVLYASPDASGNQNLAWLDASLAYELSDDAKSLLLVELSYGEGRNSAIYLRKTDGSPAVLLGYGNRPSLSRDGKWVVCIRHQANRSQLMLLPTGAGESRILDVHDVRFEAVEWFPNGKRILFTGNQSGRPVRTWMYDLDANKWVAITPEGVRATRVSPDGRSVIIADPRQILMRSVSGGESRRLAALEPGEIVLRWSGDGRYLYLQQPAADETRVTRLEVSSGRRELWRVLKVPEPGAEFFGPLAVSADGQAFVHSFQRDLANLYLVNGLR